jgi:transcriptional antiterminator RfaH
MPKEWFVLQYKANSYHQAVKNLKHQGFETFLPLHNNTSQKKSRFVKTIKPLFPGYMFISLDKTKSNWHKINNTYGVSRLVTFNSTLRPIPSTFVDILKKRYDLSGKLLSLKKFTKGDQVKVVNGPFTDFIAIVETYGEDQRIWVLMDILGKDTKIQTALRDLESTNEALNGKGV